MNLTFSESNTKQTALPLVMRYARLMQVPENNPIPYDASSQMSVFGGDTLKMMASADKSTCHRSSSTGERVRDFGQSDDDRKVDD